MAILMVAAYPFFDRYQPVKHSEIGKIDHCSVEVLTTSHYVKHTDDELEKIKPLIETARFNCKVPATIYYFNTKMLVSRAGMNNDISFCLTAPPHG